MDSVGVSYMGRIFWMTGVAVAKGLEIAEGLRHLKGRFNATDCDVPHPIRGIKKDCQDRTPPP